MLAATLGLLSPWAARATSSFPETVRGTLALPAAPDCTLCHRGAPSFTTAVTPFAVSLKARGLQAYNDGSLRNALDALRADNTDSDADGIPDLDELSAGSDPNAGTLDTAPEPSYGCGGNGTIQALLLPLVVFPLRRRLRRLGGEPR